MTEDLDLTDQAECLKAVRDIIENGLSYKEMIRKYKGIGDLEKDEMLEEAIRIVMGLLKVS